MPSVKSSHQSLESAIRRSSAADISAYSSPRSNFRGTKYLKYFWFKSANGVYRLATSCKPFCKAPRCVNDYTFSAHRFANHPYPATFPNGGPWPPRTAQDVLHAIEPNNDDCVGNLCYTGDICRDKNCSHTFENWKRVTEDWQDHFELRETADRGIGVYTKQTFKQDSTLGWYAGEIIPGDTGHYENAYLMEVPIGIQQGYPDLESDYASSSSSASSASSSLLSSPSSSGTGSYVPGEQTILIDGDRVGNWTRFINHCCEPYCEFQIRRVGRMRIIAVVATMDIPVGVEVTVSYGPLYWNSTLGKICRCGVSSCASKAET